MNAVFIVGGLLNRQLAPPLSYYPDVLEIVSLVPGGKIVERYLKSEWYVGPNQTIIYYAMMGMETDQAIEMAQKILPKMKLC